MSRNNLGCGLASQVRIPPLPITNRLRALVSSSVKRHNDLQPHRSGVRVKENACKAFSICPVAPFIQQASQHFAWIILPDSLNNLSPCSLLKKPCRGDLSVSKHNGHISVSVPLPPSRQHLPGSVPLLPETPQGTPQSPGFPPTSPGPHYSPPSHSLAQSWVLGPLSFPTHIPPGWPPTPSTP